ncbi:MAG: TrkH family potassium uptake protein [Alistipes sp.]|nr:TrkH family potassium uptake protein [Alistipes sp.]
MRFTVILRYVGTVMLCLSAFMAVSAGISFVSHDDGFYPLLLSALLTLLLGVFPMIFVPKSEGITTKEGFMIVVGSWLVSCVVGMFPYLIWGGEFTFSNAWFESVSGFTTTGASILTDVEALPQGLLFWRSATCWIGGVGVVMFALLILPSLGTNKMALSSIEMSSLARDNYRYRTQMVVKILLCIYIGMTIIFTVLLKLAGMRWFDALNHTMSACATGGFSTKNTSVGFYDSPLIEWILIVVMFLSSLHFGLLYATIARKANNIFRSEVVRIYVVIITLATLLIGASLYLSGTYTNILTSLRQSVFQVVSLISTTGFATADTTQWTPFAVIILIIVSIICGCAGSTSGGIKVDRVLLYFKLLMARLRGQQHPGAVIRIRLDGMLQDDRQINTVTLFMTTYFALILCGTLTSTLFGMDLLTAFSSSVAFVGNVGPGFGEVGSMSNYAEIPTILKFQGSILMLMGRLEIFGFIQFLFIRMWR